ncbi:MAG: hypothetical protein JWN38_274 [Candidatus Saccharibacteria bacterium]|nr:hypothetical protein [Candidatus Saccharibacteria bacterium]
MDQLPKLTSIIEAAQHIVIVQADNPDGDSLGSALALEHILSDMGKQTSLYCGVDMPGYLQYLEGWDRVSNELPKQFDASIIVDASTLNLFEKLQQSGQQPWLAAKPCIVLDHHEKVERVIPFAEVLINDSHKSSAGELIYTIARELNWPLSVAAQTNIMTCILGDTQGLSNQLASADTYHVMGEMVAAGVDRPALEELRRESSKMPQPILAYKGRLLQRAEFALDGAIASVSVPQVEIKEFSPLYNPGPLVQADMLQTRGVKVAIVFKSYDDGKVTAAIRCNPGYGIAAELAEHMGGGGHAFASGFKIETSKPFNEIKSECLSYAETILTNQDMGTENETIQHTY